MITNMKCLFHSKALLSTQFHNHNRVDNNHQVIKAAYNNQSKSKDQLPNQLGLDNQCQVVNPKQVTMK